MISLMQPTLTEREFFLLSCLVLRDCQGRGIPVAPHVLRAAEGFELTCEEIAALLGKLATGTDAILERMERT